MKGKDLEKRIQSLEKEIKGFTNVIEWLFSEVIDHWFDFSDMSKFHMVPKEEKELHLNTEECVCEPTITATGFYLHNRMS